MLALKRMFIECAKATTRMYDKLNKSGVKAESDYQMMIAEERPWQDIQRQS